MFFFQHAKLKLNISFEQSAIHISIFILDFFPLLGNYFVDLLQRSGIQGVLRLFSENKNQTQSPAGVLA